MDKYTSGAFASTKYGIYKSAQDIITSLPATIIADGQSASAVVKGNMQQSGTPTPSTPIQPSECGEMTVNLCDESQLQHGYFGNTSPYIFTADDNYRCFSLLLQAGTYTIFAKSDTLIIRLLRVSSASLGANAVNLDNQSYTLTLSVSETIYVSLRNSTTTNDFTGLTIMLNADSTPIPYEPYGQYKIPIVSGGTTTNVYLGETQSIRQIGKYLLNGQETVAFQTVSGHSRFSIDNLYQTADYTIGACSHYNYQFANENYSVYHTSTNTDKNIYVFDDNYTSANDFKSYLAQQYLAGTPVTIWYILNTETTTTLNEPIRKIDTYADSVNVSAIPTTAGSQTFDVDTTLKPSEVDLNYTGWHMYDDKKYTSGAWS